MSFKNYIITEGNNYLGDKIGDVLTTLHDLQNDIEHMGSRQVMRISDDVVNQIRIILHSQWSPNQQKYLPILQKAGVAIKKAIEEKGDIKQIIPAATQELENLSAKLGKPVSGMEGLPEAGGEDATQADMELTQPVPDPNQQGMPPQDPNQMMPGQQGMPPQDPNQMMPGQQGMMPPMPQNPPPIQGMGSNML